MTKTRSSSNPAPPALRPTPSKHPRGREEAKGANPTSNGTKIATLGNWTTINETTDYWRELLASTPDIGKPTPFTPDTIFGEGDTLHDLCKHVKKFVTLKRNTPVSVDEWTEVITNCIEDEKLWDDEHAEKIRSLALKLAWTDPTIVFDSGRWINKELIVATDTNAWMASYQLFGAPWKNRANWFPDSKTKSITNQITDFFSSKDNNKPARDSSTKKSNKQNQEKTKSSDEPIVEKPKKAQPTNDPASKEKVNPPPNTNELETKKPAPKKSALKKPAKPASIENNNTKRTSAHPTNPIFISKPLRNPYVESLTEAMKAKKKFCTYIKIRLPKIQSGVPAEQESEATASFGNIFKKLFSVDPSIELFTRNKSSRASAISRSNQLPKARDELEQFVDKLWLQKSKSPWTRLRIGHNKPIDDIISKDFVIWSKREDYTISKEKIQAKSLSKVGFLMGYHPDALNPNNLESALKQFDLMKGLEIEIRNEMIQVSRTKPRSKARAPTIWTKWEDAGKCRVALAQIYSKNNKGAYPLATQARFIPNIIDSRFITSVPARTMAFKAQDKHEAFLSRTSTAIGYTILGLDFYLEEYKVTLREAIMSIRSTKEPDYTLFTAVDDQQYSNKVVFAFRKTLEPEALAAIPGLPLILEGHYGPRVWTWFADQAKAETAGYHWDPELGLVETQEVLDFTDLDGWEDLDEVTTVEGDTQNQRVHGFEITSAPAKNQYNDNGSIKTRLLVNPSDPQDQDQDQDQNSSTQDTATSTITSIQTNTGTITLQDLLAKVPPQAATQLMQIFQNLQPTSAEDNSASTENTTNTTKTNTNSHGVTTVTPSKESTNDDMDIDQE